MAKTKSLPPRKKVKPADTWDLSSLFKTDAEWEKGFKKWEEQIPGYEKFRGKLGESAEMLSACMQFDAAVDRAGERLGVYAFLKTAEDQGNSDYQRMKGRYQHVATKAAEGSSFIRPELMSIPADKMSRFLEARELTDWRIALDRILRYRPHTLGNKEEQLLAMQGQMAEASNQIFRQLTDADLKWPSIRNEKGEMVELGHSSFSAFLHSPSRAVRKKAFHTYYTQYEAHKNSIAAALNGSVQRDVYYAKARNYPSAIEGSLFHDRVPMSVYENLIQSVHANLPAVHKYYDVRRRALKLKDGIHHYDTVRPIFSDVSKRHTWDQAVKVVVQALEPMGTEYTRELERGLTAARWCDRYPNAGKQSGAFSYGTFDAEPYIMMNYQPDVLDHVFTLAHEAGHSMHSYYSAKNQPFQYYGYTIFVAGGGEHVQRAAFIEAHDRAGEDEEGEGVPGQPRDRRDPWDDRAADDVRGVREGLARAGRERRAADGRDAAEGVSQAARPLLWPDFVIDPELELECLRIPHFYRAFYVYKYATG
jgi:oligoendopeptidase F